MSQVVLEWALRDVLAGKRGLGLLAAALLPALLLGAVVLTTDPVDASELDDVTVALLTTILMPFTVGLVAIVAGGSVLRRPLEEGTMLYQLVRPNRRHLLGMVRASAAGLSVAMLAVLGALPIGLALGQWSIVLSALPGLAIGGFLFGTLYGLIVSLHRYALGIAVLHLVADAALAYQPFRVHEVSLTWHIWSAMGEAGTLGGQLGILPDPTGSIVVPLVVSIAAVALTGLLFRLRQFGLGIGEQ